MANERINHVLDELPLISQLFEQKVYITVLDKNEVVQGFRLPEGEVPQLKVGEYFHDPSGGTSEVLRTGKPKKNFLPKEVMGEPFEGMLVPIKDGHEVVGCICCTYSVESRVQVMDIAEKFQKSIDSISDSIQTVVDGIEKLFKMLTEMNEVTTSVEKDVNTAVDVVGKISSNASRSNILALNASIEAARSGEYGRGFAVVATEMGKLANDSGKSATEIKTTLDTITTHLVSVISSIKDANNVAKEHMESISTIQDILKEAVVLADKLEHNAEK